MSQTTPPATAMMPARWVPLLYLGFAHASLVTALAALALHAESLVGFFYHPRMLAVVHLLTLGWISASILGSIYVVGPLALRMALPARRADDVAFAGFAVETWGMSSHFWIDRPRGMAWAAALVAASMAYVAVRGIARVRVSPMPFEVRLPVALAFLNVLAAAGLGAALGVNKVSPFLGVSQLDGVLAHAHLAALGWAVMMVIGVGYRMVPMILPAAMPRGGWVYASTLLLQAGVVGLAVALLRGGRGAVAWAAVAVAGLAVFLSRIVWMLRHRRPPATDVRRPDWGVAHAMSSFVYLVGASAVGLHLAAAPRSERTLAMIPVYGVLGLVGFLAQIVVGIEGRLLPPFAWRWGFADRAYTDMPPSMHAAPIRWLQATVFVLWNVAVPLLALGLAREAARLTATAAAMLMVAVAANAVNAVAVLARLWKRDRRAAR